jgi:peptidoglycan hydrolase-like protein with peptidoglycan-binding domain
VRKYTTLLATTSRRRQSRGRGVLWFVILALLAGGLWFAWNRGWFQNRNVASDTASKTNALSAQPQNPPGINTSIIVRTKVPVSSTNADPSGALSVLDAQIALDRMAISPGSIDGVPGSQTRSALRAFQLREGLPQTGELDAATRTRLSLTGPSLASHRVEMSDLARLRPLASSWFGKSEQGPLEYETVLELVAERSHTHPALIRKLNGDWDGRAIHPDGVLLAPMTERAAPRVKAAFLLIRLSERTLQAFDSNHQLLAHFPCSIAQRVDKRPAGELQVVVVVPNPDYTFNPELFPESVEARQLKTKLKLQPGPNNPVGTAWIGLNLPGYGIHGTPKPEDVGRTESHGCFRLANWNAEYLLQLVSVGTPVKVEP